MKTQKIYFLKGLPASGKSTWAREKIEKDKIKGVITKRVNKDDLRAMLDNSHHSKENEWFVNKIQSNIISDALDDGYDVIVDNTNFYLKHREEIDMIIHHMKHSHPDRDFVVEEKFFDVSPRECIERDSKREKSVGKKVILDMYHRYLRSTKYESVVHNPKLPNCIIVDVDGTLALHETRSPFDYWKASDDTLNEDIADLVISLRRSDPDLSIIIMTGRENLRDEDGYTISELTQKWLKSNLVPFDKFYIRKEKDFRQDHIVKREMYEKYIKDVYNVSYVIDDRRQVIDMWRQEGLTVLDVAGNEF